MATRSFTGNPSQIIIEQLAASGISHLFYNSGSREARFFDALYSNPRVDGILALHEGSVTAMAGGYTQVRGKPAVMSVHLGAGLAQCLGQLINVCEGALPVVIITFHGDTGSFADRIPLDLRHNAGPTSISAPFTKANWTVIDPEGLPWAVERAIMVATTPPIGPVHLAVYDRVLGPDEVSVDIIEGGSREVRAGYPSDEDVEELARFLHEAKRPLIYIGDGVWKSGAQAAATELAERLGAAVASVWNDLRGVSAAHPLHCGYLRGPALDIEPDRILCLGVRHGGTGSREDFAQFASAEKLAAVGSDVAVFENIPGVDLAVFADEKRTVERLNELVRSEYEPVGYTERRAHARSHAASLRADRRTQLQSPTQVDGYVRPLALLDAIDSALEEEGGGIVTTEQFAIPLECVNAKEGGGSVTYVRPAGGSEGYGMGASMGAKLAAPDMPVVGLVGDGSVYYADSAFWSAAHHRIPVLYVIANNASYGIVASAFDRAGGAMNRDRKYAGVALDGIDVVGLAESFGVEALRVDDESTVDEQVSHALRTVGREARPLVLDVKIPTGLPANGQAAEQFQLGSG